jgi:signal transduction histidine kinase
MEMHGGSLTIASSKGQGTTVTVRFPPSRLR